MTTFGGWAGEADEVEEARGSSRVAGRWGCTPQDRKWGLELSEKRTPLHYSCLTLSPTPELTKDLDHGGDAQI